MPKVILKNKGYKKSNPKVTVYNKNSTPKLKTSGSNIEVMSLGQALKKYKT